MKPRRLKHGNTILFDYAEFLKKLQDGRSMKGKVIVEFDPNGPMSYTTSWGQRFWKEHPYQIVSEENANQLTSLKAPSFRVATIEDVEDWYSYD